MHYYRWWNKSNLLKTKNATVETLRRFLVHRQQRNQIISSGKCVLDQLVDDPLWNSSLFVDNKETIWYLQENLCLANWSTITCSTSTSSTFPTSPSSSTTLSQSIFQVKMSSSLSSVQSYFRRITFLIMDYSAVTQSPTNAFLGTETLKKSSRCFLMVLKREHPRGRRWTFADNKHPRAI